MKSIALLITTFLTVFSLCGQNVIPKMADGTCECLKKCDLSAKNAEALQVELGLCLIEQVDVHQKALKKAGYDTKSVGIYEELGGKVGMELAINCPDFMTVLGAMLRDDDSGLKDKIIDRMSNDSGEEELAEKNVLRTENMYKGEVKAVELGDFVKIVLQDENGVRREFYWINSFLGDDVLIGLESMESLVGKTIEIGSYREEVYFHKLKAYLGINRISQLSIL